MMSGAKTKIGEMLTSAAQKISIRNGLAVKLF
jgi:hypothetical protein